MARGPEVLLYPSNDDAQVTACRITAKVAEIVLHLGHSEVVVGDVGGEAKAIAFAGHIDSLSHYGVFVEHELYIFVAALIHNTIDAFCLIEVALIFVLVEGILHLACTVDAGGYLCLHKFVHSLHFLIYFGTARGENDGCECCYNIDNAFHSFA